MGSNIIELAKLGHERAAELKASCGAVDVRSLAQLISDLATQLEVQYVRAEESQREFRSADITMQNLEAQLKQSKIDADCYKKGMEASNARLVQLAAENAGLKSAFESVMNPDNDPEYHDQGMGCGVEDRGYQRNGYAACEYGWESAMERVYSEVIPDAIPETPATDAFLAEVRTQALTNYADKRGFSFQHGSIHSHFGNGDVMVGAVTFENGDAGINFAPVRDKTGGVGTSYEWTNGKTTEQVDSVFTIASSNAEGLEVIRDKLSEAITQLRKGAAL